MFSASDPLRGYAATLRQQAAALRGRAADAVAVMESCGWEGVKAQRMDERLRQRRDEVNGLANECEALAARAEMVAQEFDQRVAQMHHFEAEVRSWMAHAAEDVVKAFLSTSRLPAPGDPRWVDVLTRVQRTGFTR